MSDFSRVREQVDADLLQLAGMMREYKALLDLVNNANVDSIQLLARLSTIRGGTSCLFDLTSTLPSLVRGSSRSS